MSQKDLSRIDPKLAQKYQQIMQTAVPGDLAKPVIPPNQKHAAAPSLDAFVKAKVAPQKTSENQSGTLLLLFLIGGMLFLGIYTFFWLRFFHIKLPFSLPF